MNKTKSLIQSKNKKKTACVLTTHRIKAPHLQSTR